MKQHKIKIYYFPKRLSSKKNVNFSVCDPLKAKVYLIKCPVIVCTFCSLVPAITLHKQRCLNKSPVLAAQESLSGLQRMRCPDVHLLLHLFIMSQSGYSTSSVNAGAHQSIPAYFIRKTHRQICKSKTSSTQHDPSSCVISKLDKSKLLNTLILIHLHTHTHLSPSINLSSSVAVCFLR